MSELSTIPAALDNLHAALQASQSLSGVLVTDGAPVAAMEPDMLIVGFTGQLGEAGVEGPVQEAGYTSSDRETYDITCLASALRGDTDMKPVRDRAFALVRVVKDILAADPRLGGAVTRARVSVQALSLDQISEGATATVQFQIHCDGFVR